jgi:hypothetical protein
VIVQAVERCVLADPDGRLWSSKAKDAQISLNRIRAVMHRFQGEPSALTRTYGLTPASGSAPRPPCSLLHALGVQQGQQWLVALLNRETTRGVAGGIVDLRIGAVREQ